MASAKSNFGKRGWFLVIFGGCVFMLGGPFWIAGFVNISLPIFAQNLGVSRPELLHIHTIVGWLIVPLTLILSPIFAKWGTRKVVSIGLLIVAIAAVFLGNVRTLAMYAVLRLVTTFTATAYSQFGVSYIYANYFPTKKGLVLGYATVGTAASNIVAVQLLNFLVRGIGFNVGLYIFAAFLVVLAIINYIFIPTDPNDVNFAPDNGDITQEELAALRKARASAVSTWTRREVITSRYFWMLVLGYGLIALSSGGVMMQLVPWQMEHGVSQPLAVTYLSTMAVFGMVGSAFSGWLDQKIGVKKTGIVLGISYVLACFFTGVMPYNFVTNALFMLFFGIMMGSISNLPNSQAISMFGSTNYANVFGLMLPIVMTLNSTPPSILAFSLQSTGSMRSAYVVFMVLCIIGTILIALTPDKMEKEVGQKPVVIKVKK